MKKVRNRLNEKLLQSKYVKRAHVNSKFQLDAGSFILNFIRELEILN